MQTHVVELTKQRLSDFFVKEDGHVAHKNALVARLSRQEQSSHRCYSLPIPQRRIISFSAVMLCATVMNFAAIVVASFFVFTTQDASDFRLGLTQKRHMIL